MHFRASPQQWSVGRRLRKGLPHNGRCPEIQGGNRQTGSWVSPPLGNFWTLENKAAWSSWQQPRPTHKLAASVPLRGPGLASCRRTPPSPPPPNLASAPVLLKSPRDPARGRGCGGHALFHAGSLANQRGARGAAAREPKPGRLLPRRAEPDRAEPSQAEPGAQSAGGGGAEPR